MKKATLKELLLVGLLPVGRTMYVWGGGWNAADTGADCEARSIGVSPRWSAFSEKQDSTYDYRKSCGEREDGLDCSGYIGWCIYNIRNTRNGNPGYVMKAADMAADFARRGWGTYTPSCLVENYTAGDIMSTLGHVYLVVGQCGDGSVVLLHSSPPGVSLAGTAAGERSEAVWLAEYYMKNYYPGWYERYPNYVKGMSYVTDYAQMRWDISGRAVMTDPDGYRERTAEQILEDLFLQKERQQWNRGFLMR